MSERGALSAVKGAILGPAVDRVAAYPLRRALASPFVVAFCVVALAWPLLAPVYMVYTVNAAGPVLIAALGLLVLQGWAREISLATAGVFGTSLYVYGWLDRPDNLGQDMPWVIAAVIAIGAVTGLMMGLAAISVRLPGVYLVVLTLGLQITLEKSVFSHGRLTGGFSGGTELGIPISNPRPDFLGLDVRGDITFYYFTLAWVALILLLVLRLRHSPAGRAFMLVGTDRQAAAAIGVAPLRYRMAAFGISGALAGAGGVLASWLFINPPIQINYLAANSLLLLAIPVLAGRDAIAWLVASAVGFQVLPMALESQQIRINVFLLAGVGLVGGALAGPRGIGGLAQDLRERWYVRRNAASGPSTQGIAGDPEAESEDAERDPYGEDYGVGYRDLDDDVLDARTGATAAEREQAMAVVSRWIGGVGENAIALDVRDARVQIGGVNVLDGVSLQIPAGAMVGLIGPNGAGKSTLFDVIAGVRPDAAGELSLFGLDLTGRPAWRRARFGMTRVFQATRVVEDLTIADNLLMGAHCRITASSASFLAGSPRAWKQIVESEEVAYAVAQVLRIDRFWHRRASEVSFSVRRRIEIGRALLAGGQLLMLDEPAAGMDPDSAAALFKLLRRLQADFGLTVLLIEHNVHAVLGICDRVLVLAHGRVIAGGTPAEIVRNEEVRAAYLGNRSYTPSSGRRGAAGRDDAAAGSRMGEMAAGSGAGRGAPWGG